MKNQTPISKQESAVPTEDVVGVDVPRLVGRYPEQTRKVDPNLGWRYLRCLIFGHKFEPFSEHSEYSFCPRCGSHERPEPEFPNRAWREQWNAGLITDADVKDWERCLKRPVILPPNARALAQPIETSTEENDV